MKIVTMTVTSKRPTTLPSTQTTATTTIATTTTATATILLIATTMLTVKRGARNQLTLKRIRDLLKLILRCFADFPHLVSEHVKLVKWQSTQHETKRNQSKRNERKRNERNELKLMNSVILQSLLKWYWKKKWKIPRKFHGTNFSSIYWRPVLTTSSEEKRERRE